MVEPKEALAYFRCEALICRDMVEGAARVGRPLAVMERRAEHHELAARLIAAYIEEDPDEQLELSTREHEHVSRDLIAARNEIDPPSAVDEFEDMMG